MRRHWQSLLASGTLAMMFSSSPVRAGESLERAIGLTAAQRYSEAREVLDSILDRRPDDSYARLLHGILHARAGRLSEAIAVFEQLRNDHPDMPEPYNNLAVLYAVQGRLDDARKVLIAVVERGPSAIAYANLGDVYAGLARQSLRTRTRPRPGWRRAFGHEAGSEQLDARNPDGIVDCRRDGDRIVRRQSGTAGLYGDAPGLRNGPAGYHELPRPKMRLGRGVTGRVGEWCLSTSRNPR